MSKWFLWMFLSYVTRSPVLALLLVSGIAYVVDRYTFGILPRPLRMFGRWRRVGYLERLLKANPHDRRARFELADLRVGQRR